MWVFRGRRNMRRQYLRERPEAHSWSTYSEHSKIVDRSHSRDRYPKGPEL